MASRVNNVLCDTARRAIDRAYICSNIDSGRNTLRKDDRGDINRDKDDANLDSDNVRITIYGDRTNTYNGGISEESDNVCADNSDGYNIGVDSRIKKEDDDEIYAIGNANSGEANVDSCIKMEENDNEMYGTGNADSGGANVDSNEIKVDSDVVNTDNNISVDSDVNNTDNYTVDHVIKRKRCDVDLFGKIQIIKMLDLKFSQTRIADFLSCSQPMISKVAKNRESILQQWRNNANPTAKRRRSGKSEQVERTMIAWLDNAAAQNTRITGPLVMAKANEMAKKMNVEGFKASSGWLHRFKRRHNLYWTKGPRISGVGDGRMMDVMMVDEVTVEDAWWSSVLPAMMQRYSLKDVYSIDETVLYYRAVCCKALSAGNKRTVAASKKMRDPISLLVACNVNGSDKRRLVVVGKGEKPICFRGIDVETLPVVYRANDNAWLTSPVFVEWLEAFDADMRRERRRVLLIVNRCAAHPRDCGDRLTNVELQFTPTLATTTKIHDLCVAENLKLHYRREMNRKVNALGGDKAISVNELSKALSLLDAVYMVVKAWRNVQPQTIVNCFVKAGYRSGDVDEQADFVQAPCGISQQDFEKNAKIDCNVSCYGPVSDDAICRETCVGYRGSDDDQIEEDGPPPEPPTKIAALAAVDTLKRFLIFGGSETWNLERTEDDVYNIISTQYIRQNLIPDYILGEKAGV